MNLEQKTVDHIFSLSIDALDKNFDVEKATFYITKLTDLFRYFSEEKKITFLEFQYYTFMFQKKIFVNSRF